MQEVYWHILSREGNDYGIYPAASPAQALLQLHRKNGHSEDIVWLEDDKLVFKTSQDKEQLGDVEDWNITRQG